ncbi:MAG: DUF4876 domain-containing protein [Mangrovibacterium sp.]
MKKILSILIFLQVLLLFSCKEYEIQPAYELKLSLNFPEGYTLSGFPDEGVTVKITNTNTGRISTVMTDASGKLSCTLVEGNYNLACSFAVLVDGEEYTFNGTKSDYLLTSGADLQVDLIMANSSDFILKEIYFAGSKTVDGKTYLSDQFHEIYNNTADTLFADGLCIGVLQQTGTSPNVWLKEDGLTFMDELPLTFQVWIVPGDGDDHPVYPGKSIVIAQDGIDHQTDPNGNPSSPVNLANADWETYMQISGKDLDAPGVPNLTMMYTTASTMTDWTASVFGSAVVIFRLPVDDWQTYVNDASHFMTLPGSTASTKYFMIDKSCVLDAVEIVRVEVDKRYKRLPSELDAGYTYIDGGTYCGKSIRRKVKMIVDERVIYKDTNNSSEDFLHDLTPTPGVNPSTVEN